MENPTYLLKINKINSTKPNKKPEQNFEEIKGI